MVDRSQSSCVLDELLVGVSARENLYDERGVLLVAEGVEITAALVDSLRRRGVKTLYREQGSSDHARGSSDQARGSSDQARGSSDKRQSIRQTPRAAEPTLSGLSPNYPLKKVERIRDQFAAGERAIAFLCQAINRSGPTDLRRTDACIDMYVNELVDDPDPVVANALAYEADLELARRCIQFSVLSMAMAQQMDLPVKQLQEIGSAAIVHDWSLFDLPADSRFPHQAMSNDARAEYRRHPDSTVEILNSIQGVSPELKQFVSQVHELLDGSGFPRGSKADQIHPLSRILCVADTYLTMTSPPKDYPRIIPCDAVAYLINGASEGKYSAKAVTGLLRAVTLYPIGSIVELSDTTKARVIRSNGTDYGYPIVESLVDTSRIINLKNADVFVTRPIPVPEYNEVRLPDTQKALNEALSSIWSR